MPIIKIDERSPVAPLLSGLCVVQEEVFAAFRTAHSIVTAPCQAADTIEVPPAPEQPWEDYIPEKIEKFLKKIRNYLTGTAIFLFDMVLDTFKSLFRWVCNGFSCVTGVVDTGNIHPEALAEASPFTLNRAKLGESYSDLPLLDVEELRTKHGITLESLKGTNLSSLHNVQNAIQLCVAHVFRRREDTSLDRPKHDELHQLDEMERMLVNLAYYLKEGGLTEHRRNEVLAKIDDSLGHCGPHRYEGLKTGFEMAIAGSLEEKLAYWAQEFKIQLILGQYQDQQMHIINDARNKAPDWGLGGDAIQRADKYAEHDRYGAGYRGISSPNYRYTLNRECTPARFLEMVKTNLEAASARQAINPFLQRLQAADTNALPENIFDVGEYWEQRTLPAEKGKPAGIEMIPTYKLVTFILERTGWFNRALIRI